MNSENTKTSEPYKLLLTLKGKINLNRSDKYVALSNLSMYKITKSHTRTINLKYQLQHEMKSLNYLMGHTLFQIFKIIASF